MLCGCHCILVTDTSLIEPFSKQTELLGWLGHIRYQESGQMYLYNNTTTNKLK